jgi:acylphosphatase
MPENLKAVHVRIDGHVQGVWFRGWTVDTATDLGLVGWVRNRRDGSVEALVQGPEDAVDRMMALCWQGPPHAHVVSVQADAVAATSFEGFVQKPTV